MVIPARPSAGFRRLAVWTAIVTYLLIVWGGIVRVTGSGNGCGTTDQWPLCHGSLLPAWQINTLIEFTHRWIASICTILVVVLTVSAWVWHRHRRKILVGVTVAAVLFVVQIALGAITVEANLPGGVVMLHLANALLLFAVLIYVAVESTTEGTARHSQGLWAAANASLKIPVLIAVVATYVVALSGAFLVATNSTGGCSSWPLCGSGFSLPTTQSATINVAHRVIAGVVVVALGGLIEDDSTKSEDRVPGLGSIPIIGYLFKNRAATSTKNNLIMFIRPKILRDPAQAAYETDLKYNYLLDQQKSLKTHDAIPLLPGVSRGQMPPLNRGELAIPGVAPNTPAAPGSAAPGAAAPSTIDPNTAGPRSATPSGAAPATPAASQPTTPAPTPAPPAGSTVAPGMPAPNNTAAPAPAATQAPATTTPGTP